MNNNKLIEEFMGMEYPKELDYNAVIVKIIKTLSNFFPDSEINYEISYKEVKLFAYNGDDMDKPYSYLDSESPDGSIEDATYKVILNFIRWYNEGK